MQNILDADDKDVVKKAKIILSSGSGVGIYGALSAAQEDEINEFQMGSTRKSLNKFEVLLSDIDNMKINEYEEQRANGKPHACFLSNGKQKPKR